jgi:Putative peptidoglycan binding domain
MADAISSVSSAIAAVLAQSVPASAGSEAVLAFQPIGLSVNPADFQSSSMQATSAMDALADVTANVVDGQYAPTLISATELFDLLLSGVAASADGAATYGQLRNQAQEAFYGGATDTLPFPGSWWDPAAPGWTTYSTSSGQPAGPGNAGPVIGSPWTWRVLPTSQQAVVTSAPPSLFKPITEVPVLRTSPTGTVAPTPSPVIAIDRAPATVADSVLPSSPVLTGLGSLADAPLAPVRLLGITRGQLAGIASISTPEPVQASQISIEFQYMTVALNRSSWWNGLLVANPGWYLPGYRAGDLAPGSLAGTGGSCGGLPTAMVLIRDLTIRGSWTSADQSALAQASTFGPFSLLGRTIGPDLTVQVAGIQIIGWFVTELPQLPPLDDPSLGPRTSPDPLAALPVLAQGTAGPFVGRAQALLGALLAPGTAGPPVTSTFDATTAQAVQAYQSAAHIAVTGEVDLATWHQLIGI